MNTETEKKVRTHGETLKQVFGLPRDTDPVALCRKLRRLEREGEALGLRLCNGPEFETENGADAVTDKILAKLDALTGCKSKGVPVFVNRDPRGYALKIESEWTAGYNSKAATRLSCDWGGYGIIAPDLSE